MYLIKVKLIHEHLQRGITRLNVQSEIQLLGEIWSKWITADAEIDDQMR
jgi:hypothetical protein